MNYQKLTQKNKDLLAFPGISIRTDFESGSLKRIILTETANPTNSVEIGVDSFWLTCLLPATTEKWDCVITHIGEEGTTRKRFDDEFSAKLFSEELLDNAPRRDDEPTVKCEIVKVQVPTTD